MPILEEKARLHAQAKNLELPMTLQLFSDATSSQNKNTTMMAYLLSYAQRSQVFNKIKHVFPIRGHSLMPPDRIFDRVEQEYQKKQQILSPREYHEILQNFGTLKILGTDWRILNFKKCADNITKKKLPFLMREQRIFNYEKGSENVSVQNTYTGNGNQYAIQKKTNVEQ